MIQVYYIQQYVEEKCANEFSKMASLSLEVTYRSTTGVISQVPTFFELHPVLSKHGFLELQGNVQSADPVVSMTPLKESA